MRFSVAICLIVVSLLASVVTASALAQPADPAAPVYDAAVELFKRASQPQTAANYANLIRGLRLLEDPDLLGYFELLAASKHPPMQVFGLMGSAPLKPERAIDLTQTIQIEQPVYLGVAVTSAMDDKLITTEQLKTVVGWQDLTRVIRLIIALKLTAEGEPVDLTPFEPALEHDLANDDLSQEHALEFAYAALLFSKRGKPQGNAAMRKLLTLKGGIADYAIAQMFMFARRDESIAAGPIALAVAKDSTRESPMRLQALRTALRLRVPGSQAYWRTWFDAEISLTGRARLAIAALDVSSSVEPAMFAPLLATEQDYLQRIGALGQAIAAKRDPLPAAKALLELGQPTTNRWLLNDVRKRDPEQAARLLEAIIRNYRSGLPANRGQVAQVALDAVVALCEMHPEHATDLLPRLLQEPAQDEADEALRRQIVLIGILNCYAPQDALTELAKRINTPKFESLSDRGRRLLIRARFGADLSNDNWQTLGTYLQGVGQLPEMHLAQLAWAYLKHHGLQDKALAEATR